MSAGWAHGPQVLRDDDGILLCRACRESTDGERKIVLAVLPAAEHPTPQSLDRLAHEFRLRDELDVAWAVKPVELLQDRSRAILVLEDFAGEPLTWLMDAPMEVGDFLRLAVQIAAALGKVHQSGLVHKDIKPANILVNHSDVSVRFTGFGFASRRPRERQPLAPPDSIAGTIPYMAPEQTGRMNRSIDSRSDLYSLGVTFYQMLTGSLPFAASDSMEWVHCHVARRPVTPRERVETIPAAVSEIIMKLLAKMAEDRYQTAAGVEKDLRRCLAEWQRRHSIREFPLGQHDTPDRLLIPEKLYGRERELDTLLTCFDRAVKNGGPQLVLVSGYSGIGKSSIINELHKVLVPFSGLFASGKFDQYKRDIPYTTLTQAFQGLVSPLLGKSDAELSGWQHDFMEALGPNGQLIVDLIPELKLIIGEQAPAPELSAQHAQSRFQRVFQRFIGVFARPEHPLVLFLDDLQWLDAATLELLKQLSTRSELKHLLLIGAYRDNEVDATHPLMRMLGEIRGAGGPITEITLEPLDREHLGQLLADALRCKPECAAPLAQLVLQKTGGNPFFAIQFLFSLADEGLLAFDHDAGRWSWELGRIHAKRYTANVVDFMLGKLTRLPTTTRTALQQMACLGNLAETEILSNLLGVSEDEVHAALSPAVGQELVEPQARSYRFVHDRFQEAAYALAPEADRPAAHLRIGRLLAARTAPQAIEENVFEIVSQLNRGAALITAAAEREGLAELNLLAGRRAKAAAAFAMALAHFSTGEAMLGEDRWERRYALSFALALHRAECEFLIGEQAAAKLRLAELASRAATLPDLAAVTRLQMEPNDRDIELALAYLRRVGIEWPAQPTSEQVAQEYERMWRQIGERPIESLLDLPQMTDPVACGTMDVLTVLVSPAWYIAENLRRLIVARMANLSMEYGNSDASCLAYIVLATVLGPDFGDYEAGYHFAQLGLDLVERHGSDRFKARVYLGFGSWTRHIRSGRPLLRRAFDAAQQVGDFNYASFTYHHLVTHLLACGDPLAEVQREAEAGIEFAHRAGVDLAVDRIIGQLQLIRSLRGLTPRFGCLDDADFDEEQFERRLEADPRLVHAACWYWVRKLQGRVLADDPSAIAAAAKAEQFIWTSKALFDRVSFDFYAALALAAHGGAGSAEERAAHYDALAAHHRQLQQWADICPEDFADRATIVAAEIARLEGRELDAMRFYDRAIASAHANGFVHHEALANELAGRFYASRGFEKIAYAYLRDARYAYLRWGAYGKVRQLERVYPRLHVLEHGGAAAKVSESIHQMDVATVVKASQAVSTEIELPRLIETLMKMAAQNAGADRGLLILLRQNEFWIEAEGQSSGDEFAVVMRHGPISGPDCPEAILRYVIRTQKTLIVDDASRPDPLCDEAYVQHRRPRSMLCVPLIKQAKLTGLLYFENTLATHAFTPDRVAMLEMLAAQSAISLENTLLYRDLQDREARIRRLVDSNIIGILFWELPGRISYVNDAFLGMTGYTRQELVSGAVGWDEMTPPEYHAEGRQRIDQLRSSGELPPREREFFRKDGSRIPVLIGSALVSGSADQSISFVLDLTKRKQAEAEARESERRYQEMQLELAHANRVATMGHLTSSIAHEVSQPISAVAINASAALNWLARNQPDLDKVRLSVEQIVKDAQRSSEVIGRLRELFKKALPRKERLDLNEAVGEVIVLTGSEAIKNGVFVKTQLADDLPPIEGDRVQLQQVLLNLVVNAIQAMSAVAGGGRDLLISTARAESNSVLVRVADTGPGLDPETLEQVFDPYYTSKPHGMGMGLAICRSIIDAHSGRLWASANQPHGAVFQFTLPVGPGGNS